MAVFSICQYFGRYFGNLNNKCSFEIPNSDGELLFLTANATVTIILEQINGDTVIQNLVCPLPN